MDQAEVIAWLKRNGSKRVADGMARFGIVTQSRVVGVSMGGLQTLAKQLKKQLDPHARHELAKQLWQTDCYEARLLAPLVDDPLLVTRRQMNSWAADFDNWATCDTVCLHLFDRTPHAWAKAKQWSSSRHEFTRRAAFTLIAGLALHDKSAPDSKFLPMLPLIDKATADDRNFVMKAVNWALRAVGERSTALNRQATELAQRLAASDEPARRWIGRDALRKLSSPAVRKRLARRQPR